ncbi:MAG: DUF4038 domain-containing protein, partial [Defluviitaleaceae bacterium]|nr:DUF4038 domain-containing protein [Defluviitaleaceae bacterium]
MPRIRVSADRRRFVRDDENGVSRDFFLMCDTFWSALYNPTDAEWEAYLRYRKMQGYNAVQFNALHQWDSGAPDTGLMPFAVKPDGSFDFRSYNEEYFSRAERMAKTAYGMGIIPVVVVLHCSYVKGTWATKDHPEWVMPLELVKPFARKVARLFMRYDPMYIISGDTNFPGPETNDYFMAALEGVKGEDPEGLCTFHMSPDSRLPEVFVSSGMTDFYCLQPGQGVQDTKNLYKLVNEYYNSPVTRPVLNDEFTYEGGSYTGDAYGRWNAFDQRKGIWQSLLAGS